MKDQTPYMIPLEKKQALQVLIHFANTLTSHVHFKYT